MSATRFHRKEVVWHFLDDISIVRHPENAKLASRSECEEAANVWLGVLMGDKSCRSDFILIIILVIFLLGGFSGRFGGYGYGYGHGGIGIIGVILIILVVLLLMGRL